MKKYPEIVTSPEVCHSSVDSSIPTHHHLWIHDKTKEHNRETFQRLKRVGANDKDMKGWKEWISWKDFESDNHRK